MRRNRNRYITSVHGSNERSDDLITIILFSEKAGHRMKSYGPTPLIKLGRRTLLDEQISAIKSVYSNFELIICAGFDCEKIVKFVREKYSSMNIRIVENQMYHHSNCCESARLCLNNTTNDKILLCNGDLLIKTDVISLVAGKYSHVIAEAHGPSDMEIGITVDEDGHATHFSYGIENKWSEIIFLHDSNTIETFRKIVSGTDYKTKFLFEALNDLNKTKCQLRVVKNSQAPLIKIDNIKTYHKVRKSYENSTSKLRNV